mgnify:CR=1 FL=1|jgi:hypothetical protein
MRRGPAEHLTIFSTQTLPDVSKQLSHISHSSRHCKYSARAIHRRRRRRGQGVILRRLKRERISRLLELFRNVPDHRAVRAAHPHRRFRRRGEEVRRDRARFVPFHRAVVELHGFHRVPRVVGDVLGIVKEKGQSLYGKTVLGFGKYITNLEHVARAARVSRDAQTGPHDSGGSA